MEQLQKIFVGQKIYIKELIDFYLTLFLMYLLNMT